jgi:hypothetical protein
MHWGAILNVLVHVVPNRKTITAHTAMTKYSLKPRNILVVYYRHSKYEGCP